MAMMKVAKEKCNDGSDECFTGGLDDGLEHELGDGSDECFTGGLDDGLEDELSDGISECCTVLMDLMWG